MPVGFVDGGSGSSPEELFRSIPPISKALIVGMLGTLVCSAVGIFPASNYVLSWTLVWNKFHLWRFVTAAIYPGQPGFPSLFLMFSMGMFSIRYEKDGFTMGGGGGSADYAYMLMFGVTILEAVLLLFFYQPFHLLTEAVLFYICYVWSRKNPTMSVSFWGIPIGAPFVPWVMVAFRVLTGQSIFHPLLGIAVGHLFYFLVDVLPDLHDIDLLHTPNFLVNMFGWGTEGSGVTRQGVRPAMPAPGVVQPPRDMPRTGGGRSQWGTGRTLGSS
ncbi:unnamed protein product [Laminaria digitata]